MQNKPLKELKQKLFFLLKKEAFRRGKVRLSSGKISSYYLDARKVTLSPQGVYLIAEIVLRLLRGKRVRAIGGPTIGADPIVAAVSLLSHLKGKAIKAFIVRKSAKAHGMQRQIEGPLLEKNLRVVLVDDVATSGNSLIEAKKALKKEKVNVAFALVVIDREEGARENLKKAGLKLFSIFKASDFGV